ncbi:MAG: helix-turn-helix domain-containing protein [Bryobacteraceae bacterium]
MNMNKSRKWLIDKAEQEDGCLVSVGGLVDALEQTEETPSNVVPFKHAFVRFVQLARRKRKLTLDQFAEKVDVDLAELLRIEKDEHYTPAIRTVHQIAEFFKIPEKRLMALAGLLRVKDAQFQKAALKFAASSEPVEKLSQEEHAALEEYVKFLCDR